MIMTFDTINRRLGLLIVSMTSRLDYTGIYFECVATYAVS